MFTSDLEVQQSNEYFSKNGMLLCCAPINEWQVSKLMMHYNIILYVHSYNQCCLWWKMSYVYNSINYINTVVCARNDDFHKLFLLYDTNNRQHLQRKKRGTREKSCSEQHTNNTNYCTSSVQSCNNSKAGHNSSVLPQANSKAIHR